MLMDLTKGKEKGRSNAPPRYKHINNMCPIVQL